MEHDLKLALGQIKGEIYRLQKAQGISNVSDGHIYGLLNGIEEAIDNELAELEVEDLISNHKVEAIRNLLEEFISKDKDVTEAFANTFRLMAERKYDISQTECTKILKYLRAKGEYEEILSQVGSYELNKYDF